MTTNYSRLYDIPGPNWQYRPYAGRYGTGHCAYCGERATTVDRIPNLLYARAPEQRLRQVWLVDACQHCRGIVEASEQPTFNARRHAVLVALRKAYRTCRGPKTALRRVTILRRQQYAGNERNSLR